MSLFFLKGVVMGDDKNAIREVPRHDIQINASTQDRSLIKEFGKGVMEEVIIPRSKESMRNMSTSIVDMFAEAMRNFIDKVLYPDGNVPYKKTNPQNGGVYTGITNYTSFSRPIGNYQPQKPVETISQRPGNEVKYVWVWTEDDAKKLTGALKEDIENYGYVKVATLYEILKEKTTMADFTYGWTDVNTIRYYYDSNRRADEPKWFIDLPKPEKIIG